MRISINIRGDYSQWFVEISINIRGEIRSYELTRCTCVAVGEFVPPLGGDVGPELFIDTRGDMCIGICGDIYRYSWRYLSTFVEILILIDARGDI